MKVSRLHSCFVIAAFAAAGCSVELDRAQDTTKGDYYIRGEVRNPGSYRLGASKTTLPILIDRAGGLTERAASGYIQVIFDGKTNRYGLDAIKKGRQPNAILPVGSTVVVKRMADD